MAHVPVTFQLAYRQYVNDMQQAHDDSRGFTPIDRIIMKQPLSKMLSSLLLPDVDLHEEDKFQLVVYHYRKHGIDLTMHEHALTRWLIAAGNEHAKVIESLDSRPPSLRLIPIAGVASASHRGEGSIVRETPTADLADGAPLWEDEPPAPPAPPAGFWDGVIEEVEEIESRQASVVLQAPAPPEAPLPPGLRPAPTPPSREQEAVVPNAPLRTEHQPRAEAQQFQS